MITGRCGGPTRTAHPHGDRYALPLDIALFHVAAPYPGTPLFFDVVRNGRFRPGTRWEEADMDEGTVLDYPGLAAEALRYWQRRAFREWALRPGPIWTFLESMNSWPGFKSAIDIGLQTLGWVPGVGHRRVPVAVPVRGDRILACANTSPMA